LKKEIKNYVNVTIDDVPEWEVENFGVDGVRFNINSGNNKAGVNFSFYLNPLQCFKLIDRLLEETSEYTFIKGKDYIIWYCTLSKSHVDAAITAELSESSKEILRKIIIDRIDHELEKDSKIKVDVFEFLKDPYVTDRHLKNEYEGKSLRDFAEVREANIPEWK